jgi:protein-arginine kinase
VCLKLIDSISVAGLNRMTFMSQPAHLQKRYGKEMGPTERDAVRADMIRGILAEEEARAGAG